MFTGAPQSHVLIRRGILVIVLYKISKLPTPLESTFTQTKSQLHGRQKFQKVRYFISSLKF